MKKIFVFLLKFEIVFLVATIIQMMWKTNVDFHYLMFLAHNCSSK